MISVWIPGEPKGQPRPRAFARKAKVAGKVVHRASVYSGKTAEGWKGLVALALRPFAASRTDEQRQGPFEVDMVFSMPRPAAMRRKRAHPEDGEVPHTKKPDVDNLAKAVLDVCTQIRIWHDDASVVDLRVRKVYHRDKGGTPGMELKINPAI